MFFFQYILAALLGLMAWTIVAAPTPGDERGTGVNTTTFPAVDFINSAIPKFVPGENRSAVVTPDGQVLNNNLQQGGEAGQSDAELVVFMGTKRQHVGYTVTQNLPEILRSILRIKCTNDKPIPGPVCDRGELDISNIAYNVGHEAYVGVQVESDWIPKPADDKANPKVFLDLFIEQIVETFKAAINCEKNRYQLGSGMKCREFANSADFYQVGIHGREDFPHLRVKIWFNGKTDEGQFDCLGSQSGVWNSLTNEKIQQYASAGNYNLLASVRCSDGKSWVPGYPTGTCKYEPAVKPMDLTCKLQPNCVYH